MARALIKAAGGLVGGGIAIFAGTGALDDNTTRNETGEIVEGGGLGAFAIQVGDCFNEPDAELVTSVEAVPCGEPHDNEVYAEFDLVGGVYPGDQSVIDQSGEGCYTRFEPALGEVFEDSQLWFSFLSPSRESWSEGGDRVVTCYVYIPETILIGKANGGYTTRPAPGAPATP